MITYPTTEGKTFIAVEYSNKYFRSEHDFYQHYMNIDFKPDMSDLKLHEIIFLMATYMFMNEVEVVKWYPKWRWTKAIGMTIGDGKIHLNARKMDRPVGDIIETLVHETVHLVDNENDMSFGHGDNSPQGKGLTAPYLIGRLANAYFTSGKLYTAQEIRDEF